MNKTLAAWLNAPARIFFQIGLMQSHANTSRSYTNFGNYKKKFNTENKQHPVKRIILIVCVITSNLNKNDIEVEFE